MKVAIIGAGYVGMANALVVARVHQAAILEIDASMAEAIQAGRLHPRMGSEFGPELAKARARGRLSATVDPFEAFDGAPWALVCVPTDFDESLGRFDASAVEAAIFMAQQAAPGMRVAIRSTMPIGGCERLALDFPGVEIVYAPEFLREGSALADALEPSRIVVGPQGEAALAFIDLLASCGVGAKSQVALMGASEAEACKLYSNACLAMRVAFFNEIDSGCMALGLDARQVIEGVCMDPRIGAGYNNPSFGYGGYCLPKDSRQVASEFSGPARPLLGAIVSSNAQRMDFIAQSIAAKSPRVVGVHSLAMKGGSGNSRSASSVEVAKKLADMGISVWVHDPTLSRQALAAIIPGALLVESLDEFLAGSDIILANRMGPQLEAVKEKVFSRDLFGRG